MCSRKWHQYYCRRLPKYNMDFLFVPVHATLQPLTLSQNKPSFLHVCNTHLLKTLWEKDKLLIMGAWAYEQSQN